jgi:hypothetical protein
LLFSRPLRRLPWPQNADLFIMYMVSSSYDPLIWPRSSNTRIARATTEPPQTDWKDEGAIAKFDQLAATTWSKGYGAAGASLFTNITKLIPGSTGYPVHYPASSGNSMPVGIKDMLAELSKQSTACPKQKFVIGGHSQGGMVTTSVIPQIPKDILAKIIAVTMFGSPPCPAAVQDRCHSYCNKGDFVRLLSNSLASQIAIF